MSKMQLVYVFGWGEGYITEEQKDHFIVERGNEIVRAPRNQVVPCEKDDLIRKWYELQHQCLELAEILNRRSEKEKAVLDWLAWTKAMRRKML